MMTTIYNMPEYAKKYDFIVVTMCGKDFWFCDAYADKDKADAKINGFVVETKIFW